MSSPLPSPTTVPANDNDVKMDSSLQFIKNVGGGGSGNNGNGNSGKSPVDSGSQFYIPLPSPLSTPSPAGSLPSSPLPSNLPIFQARKKVQFMVEDRIIQDKDKNDDYEDEDNENDVDDNKDNNSSCSSFSVYDDVATTIVDDYTSNPSPNGDYDVMCNDNKNHKGNGNGSINNISNSKNNGDTDDITLSIKHGKPIANNNKTQLQHYRQQLCATSKSNHGKFSFSTISGTYLLSTGCCNLLHYILVLW